MEKAKSRPWRSMVQGFISGDPRRFGLREPSIDFSDFWFFKRRQGLGDLKPQVNGSQDKRHDVQVKSVFVPSLPLTNKDAFLPWTTGFAKKYASKRDFEATRGHMLYPGEAWIHWDRSSGWAAGLGKVARETDSKLRAPCLLFAASDSGCDELTMKMVLCLGFGLIVAFADSTCFYRT